MVLHAGVVGLALGHLLDEHRARHLATAVERRRQEAPRRNTVHGNPLAVHIGLEHQTAACGRCFDLTAEFVQHPLVLALQVVCACAAGDAALQLNGRQAGNLARDGGRQAEALGRVVQPRRTVDKHHRPLVNGRLHLRADGHIDLERAFCIVDMQHFCENTSNPC